MSEDKYVFKDWVVYASILVILIMGWQMYGMHKDIEKLKNAKVVVDTVKLKDMLEEQHLKDTFMLNEIESNRMRLDVIDKKDIMQDKQLYEFHHDLKKCVRNEK